MYDFLFQDLVKSHLMSAVRSEVEELRDKISKLEVIHFYVLIGLKYFLIILRIQ